MTDVLLVISTRKEKQWQEEASFDVRTYALCCTSAAPGGNVSLDDGQLIVSRYKPATPFRTSIQRRTEGK